MIKFAIKSVSLFLLLLSLKTIVFSQNDYKRAYLWAKEIEVFAKLDKKSFPKKGGILFVGSSSIRGWSTLSEDFQEFPIINRGFGGSHLEDVNFYAAQIVFPRRPRLIVLYAGENDLAAGKSIETVFNDFKKFVFLVREKLPKARLIIISVKPSPARREFMPQFAELNCLIKKQIENDKRLLFVDVWKPMLDQNGEPKKEIFQADKLHLNAEGYKIWRETLYPAIKENFKN